MATRSTISIKTPEGKYNQIYCHFDGYLSHVGKTLIDHYNTPERVNQLIALGNISSLGKHLGPPKRAKDEPHDSEYGYIPQSDVTVAYARDIKVYGHLSTSRSDKESDPMYNTHDSLAALESASEEYNYVFEDNQWQLATWPHHGEGMLSEIPLWRTLI